LVEAEPGLLGILGISAIVLIFFTEFVIPFRKEWSQYKRTDLSDFGHFILVMVIGDGFARMLIHLYAPFIINAMPIKGTLWPEHWHLVFQVLLAIFIYDFVYYWYHRLYHKIPMLWRMHRLHHSPEKLNLTKLARFNVIELFFENLIIFGILIVLGISAPAAIWFYAIATIAIYMKHANLDIKYPYYLDWILVLPTNHRIHHSPEPENFNINFGGFTMIWDVIFGTYKNGALNETPKVGLYDYKMSDNFILQVFDFLRPNQASKNLDK
jgi:sterol desaturase/sphingolipid hydroxylase (fatty acid hydroxylase superfamily)